ncbi:MAG TPA: hypothetical protein VLF89_03640 [Candidatus Saccharimonadales bacterium]|nr:hypothetical protein [Candidatus Saccharimonadales bacterium]
MNYVNFPLLNPFKFYPNVVGMGNKVHFDDTFAVARVRRWEVPARYKQKWQKADTTPLQIESSLAPNNLILVDFFGATIKQFTWNVVFTGTSYKIYETTFDVSDVAEGVYFLYQKVTLGGITWRAISEEIDIRVSWPDTAMVRYYNSYNDWDVAFTANGIQFKFRCECGLTDFNPLNESTDFVDQTHDTKILFGVPFREFKFSVGVEPGVAEWVPDLLNRIWLCDQVYVEEKQFAKKSGSTGQVTRVKGYPLVGWAIDVVEAKNQFSLQMSDTTPLDQGLVIAYDIETDWFGPANTVNVLEVEENG